MGNFIDKCYGRQKEAFVGGNHCIAYESEIMHKIKYECIDAEVTQNTTLCKRGGSGPSGMDADGWRRILTSNSFGQSPTNICMPLANVAKKLCVESDQTNSLKAL